MATGEGKMLVGARMESEVTELRTRVAWRMVVALLVEEVSILDATTQDMAEVDRMADTQEDGKGGHIGDTGILDPESMEAQDMEEVIMWLDRLHHLLMAIVH
jgi:hypothetical protein